MNLEPLGIIAGTGTLPAHVAIQALERGHRVVVIALVGFTDKGIEKIAHETVWMKLGQLQRAVDTLKANGVTRVVMVGKIEKANLMRPWNIGLDLRGFRMLRNLTDWRDDTVLAGIANELLRDGIVIDEITGWAGSLMAPMGVITRRPPDKREWTDVEFGREMAKGIGKLDIGQTVLVKNAAVIVVEAIEGTDRAIRRAGDLGITGAVVVKMAKPQQDMRFDVPGVGSPTIEAMLAAKATVLAVEAGRTMITDYDDMKALADRSKISVVGIPPEGPIR
ncbi:MAG: UDP-2,3-diacylglucosamine diphosphatase LpxI [Pseudomonadota bacterium]